MCCRTTPQVCSQLMLAREMVSQEAIVTKSYDAGTSHSPQNPQNGVEKPRKTLAVHSWRGFSLRAHFSFSSKGMPQNCRGEKVGEPKATSTMGIHICLLSSPAPLSNLSRVTNRV